MLDTAGHQSAELLQAGGKPITGALELGQPDYSGTSNPSLRCAEGMRRDEREALGNDSRQLVLEPGDLGAKRGADGELLLGGGGRKRTLRQRLLRTDGRRYAPRVKTITASWLLLEQTLSSGRPVSEEVYQRSARLERTRRGPQRLLRV
jgi:hypothetical protein